MKLQDQVCTLEQAKRLKELRVSQTSYFYYAENVPGIHETWMHEGFEGVFYSAFTVAELGQMLPSETFTERTGTELSQYANWQWINQGIGKALGPYNTESEARADHLIHLLETNAETAEEVNKRLEA